MTTIKSGSPLTQQAFSVALFSRATRGNNFAGLMTDNAPSAMDAKKTDPTQQTPQGAPIVRVTDLSKTAGDKCSMDVFNPPRKKPTMGDQTLSGRGENLTFNTFDAIINQGRKMLNTGGKMTQKRTKIDLLRLSVSLLTPYYRQLSDEITTIHLAGSRGTDVNDWILPLDSDEDFADIMVNPIAPPTFDRHFYGNDATSLDTLDSTDKLTLADIDRLRLLMQESANPLQPVKYTVDSLSDENPFYVLCVSPRQWYDLQQSAGAQTLAALRANAMQRAGKMDHPLFTGESYMFNNILIKRMAKPITFAANVGVSVSTNVAAATTTTVIPTVKVDRAILLGAQALADIYGDAGDNSGAFAINTEDTDHKNAKEVSIRWMNGKKKIRFKDSRGYLSDFGCAVLDTARSG